MKKESFSFALLFTAFLLTGHTSFAVINVIQNENQKLDHLLDQYTKKISQNDPFEAPKFNVKGYDSELGDFPSAKYFERTHQMLEGFSQAAKKIRAEKLDSTHRLDLQVFTELISDMLNSDRHEGHHYMNLTAQANRLTEFVDQADPSTGTFSFNNLQNYADFAERMKKIPAYVHALIAFERDGIKKGYRLSCYDVKRTSANLASALEKEVEKNPFWAPIDAASDLDPVLNPADLERLKTQYTYLIQNEVNQAYTEAIQFLNNEYSQNCVKETGLTHVSNGQELYRDLLRSRANTDLSPAQIHQMGLREVERIKSEFLKVQKTLGFSGTFTEFINSMRTDPKNFFASKEELIARFNEMKTQLEGILPKYFVSLPKSSFEIKVVDKPGGAYAQYPTPVLPKGYVVLPVKDLDTYTKYEVTTLFLHEGLPGHLMAGTTAFENHALSNFRVSVYVSDAFDEGWALYAEHLGIEMGIFDDPYLLFGHLTDDMVRAVRLVVDTGLHSGGWTRDQAVQYMDSLVPQDMTATEYEIDRYLSIPGQAVSYKIGQFKIIELRSFAEKELGTCFDLRKFNSAVIQDGAMSLHVLDQKMRTWTSDIKKKCSSHSFFKENEIDGFNFGSKK